MEAEYIMSYLIEECRLLGCDAVWVHYKPTFRGELVFCHIPEGQFQVILRPKVYRPVRQILISLFDSYFVFSV
jgi:hypothetical protein